MGLTELLGEHVTKHVWARHIQSAGRCMEREMDSVLGDWAFCVAKDVLA